MTGNRGRGDISVARGKSGANLGRERAIREAPWPCSSRASRPVARISARPCPNKNRARTSSRWHPGAVIGVRGHGDRRPPPARPDRPAAMRDLALVTWFSGHALEDMPHRRTPELRLGAPRARDIRARRCARPREAGARPAATVPRAISRPILRRSEGRRRVPAPCPSGHVTPMLVRGCAYNLSFRTCYESPPASAPARPVICLSGHTTHALARSGRAHKPVLRDILRDHRRVLRHVPRRRARPSHTPLALVPPVPQAMFIPTAERSRVRGRADRRAPESERAPL